MEDLIMRRNTTEYWKRFIPVLLLLAGNLFAIPVAESDARLVASNFYRSLYPQKGDLEISPISLFSQSKQTKYEFYAYQIKGGGFVILANDDAAIPVIGYSDSGSLVEFIDHPAIEDIFESYNLQLKQIKDYRLDNSATVNQWKELRQNDVSEYQGKAAVAPLVATRWNQGSGWNGLCPTVSGGPGGRAYAGCVAVTMAQIMKFWNYPSTGNGSNTYTPSGFPSQSVNFAAQIYNWSAMSNTAYGSEIQKILYHAGVAINMMYGAIGSGAYTYWPGHKSAYDALINNFRYANTIQAKYRSSYSDANWIALLKTELDAGRPIAYSGSGSGGHSFICDGYDATNKMHFNWGWGGYADGYFAVTSLNPAGRNYTNAQEAMIGIKPADNVAPVANNDSYFVFAGNSLITTTANGVLKNDTDANGNALTAVKLSDPAGGTLSFNANGTFTFTAPSQAGTYSFTYQANDGSMNSNTATVTLKVSEVGDGFIAKNLKTGLMYYKDNIMTAAVNIGNWLGYNMYFYDLDGNGSKDLLGHNPITGKIYYRSTVSSSSVIDLGTAPASDLFFADIDGDGVAEVLVRNAAGILFYKSSIVAAWVNVGNWKGYNLYFYDLDGNNTQDLIGYNTVTGKLYCRSSITQSSVVELTTAPGANLYFANMDDDNAYEVLLRNSAGILYYKSSVNATWANVGNWKNYTLYFYDLDGNHTQDLIGYNSTTGKLYYRNNITQTAVTELTAAPGANLYIVNTDDDNSYEILLRNSAGILFYKSSIEATWVNVGSWKGYYLYFFDMDGNATQDLIGYNLTTGKIYCRNIITNSTVSDLGTAPAATIYFSDADNDGSMELFVRNSAGILYFKPSITAEWIALDNWSGYNIFFGTYNCSVKRNEGVVPTEISSGNVFSTFILEQNYPNPFNITTTINYKIPVSANVKISIYNAKGEFVKELINREHNAGNYVVQFQAGDVNSGLYFYKMEAGNKIIINKMVMVK